MPRRCSSLVLEDLQGAPLIYAPVPGQTLVQPGRITSHGQIGQFPGDVITQHPLGPTRGADREHLHGPGLDDRDVAIADERSRDREAEFDGPANYVCHRAGRAGRFPW